MKLFKYASIQIARIQVHSCPDVVLAVDLESMNPGVQVLEVKNSQSVRIESVKFDPEFENKQRLRMIFTNVVSSTLANLEVTETLQVMPCHSILFLMTAF